MIEKKYEKQMLDLWEITNSVKEYPSRQAATRLANKFGLKFEAYSYKYIVDISQSVKMFDKNGKTLVKMEKDSFMINSSSKKSKQLYTKLDEFYQISEKLKKREKELEHSFGIIKGQCLEKSISELKLNNKKMTKIFKNYLTQYKKPREYYDLEEISDILKSYDTELVKAIKDSAIKKIDPFISSRREKLNKLYFNYELKKYNESLEK